jgi:prepilin-type N-terminal cleavage/methylation domain-containing protein
MHNKGFTLTELLIAMAIMAILALVALPGYSRYVARSRQQDARSQLMAIRQAQEIYKLQYGSYTANTTLLSGWLGTLNRYTFSVTGADASAFTARATGNIDGDPTKDVWQIDQSGTMTNTTDDVNS